MTHWFCGSILGAAVMAAPFAWADIVPEAKPLSAIRGADIVFLGEIHDNPTHHLLQSDLMEALQPSAVVFEMLTSDQVYLIETEPFDTLANLDELIGWTSSGWPEIEIYGPVFNKAFGRPIFGAAVPRGQARSIMQETAAIAFGPEAETFGLDVPLPDAQTAIRLKLQGKAHCDAMPEEMLPLMIDVQRYRDARLAQVALEAFEAYGGPVVVITGNGHARTDWGAPYMIGVANAQISVASVGMLESAPTVPPPYDSWMVTKPIERPDPCLAFK